MNIQRESLMLEEKRDCERVVSKGIGKDIVRAVLKGIEKVAGEERQHAI